MLGLVEFELVESEVELVQHDDIVLVISVVVHSSQQHSLLLVLLLQNECLYITLTHTLIHHLPRILSALIVSCVVLDIH